MSSEFWTVFGISGERLDGVDSEAAAQKLRGRAGTIVTVKVHSVIIILSLYNINFIFFLCSDTCWGWTFESVIEFFSTYYAKLLSVLLNLQRRRFNYIVFFYNNKIRPLFFLIQRISMLTYQYERRILTVYCFQILVHTSLYVMDSRFCVPKDVEFEKIWLLNTYQKRIWLLCTCIRRLG